MFSIKKKFLVIAFVSLGLIAIQTSAQKEHGDEKFTNLKVLPKNISHEELIKIMRAYSTSLGVHCDFCHVAQKSDGPRPKMDFASDAKPEKQTAREMMAMTEAINTKYLAKMSGDAMEQITCVTCHNGKAKPNTSLDSLMRH